MRRCRFLFPGLLAIAAATPALAAERTVYLTGFDKVRLQGPYEVRVETGRPAGATLTGDAAALEGVEVQVEGTTLIIRPALRQWDERSHARPGAPVVVAVTTQTLVTASVLGAGRLAIARMQGPRIDLTVSGPGGIAVADAAAEAANATVIGAGTITLAGKAGRGRLTTNGTGTIDAAGLEVGNLAVRLDGPGTTRAQARYTAVVDNVGLGEVTVAGKPKCTVRAAAGGPVSCGSGR